MKFIMKHKFTSLIILVFIVIVIILYFVYDFFFSAGKNPEYGNRLEGIEAVEIKSEEISKMTTAIKEDKSVKNVSINVSGKTLEIVITVNDDVSIANAKKIGQASYKTLSEKQIKFYAIQVFIKKDDATKNNFPIIGYEDDGKTTLSWTKDREVTKTNETK